MEEINQFKPINIFAELLPFFSCNCEKMMDDMVGRWSCPVHGKRQPNYAAIFKSQKEDAYEDEHLMEWDELSEAGQHRRMERRITREEARREGDR